jgi:uncharacterized protein
MSTIKLPPPDSRQFRTAMTKSNNPMDVPQSPQPASDNTCLEILYILRREKAHLREEFGLLSIGVFGSFARGAQETESDIDLLVEFSEPSFDSLAGLQIYLEGRLGRHVDLIRRRKGLSPRFLGRIEKDVLYA